MSAQPSDLTVPSLPAELWVRILKELAQPAHRPLSRPARSELQQNAQVAIASRVSRLFNDICTEILYREVTTDNLPQFLRNIHLPSFRRRLAHTRKLFIENCAKGQHASYAQLCGGAGLWGRVGRLGNKLEDVVFEDADEEVGALLEALKRANKLGGIKTLFPKLETAAICPVYGREDNCWEVYDVRHTSRRMEPRTLKCGDLFNDFFSNGNMRQICVRDPEGPLAFPTLSYASDSPPSGNFLRVVHFSETVNHLSTRIGSKLRWVYDGSSTADWAEILIYVMQQMRNLNQSRTRNHLLRRHSDKLDVEIYCSTSRFIPAKFFDNIGRVELDRIDFTLPFQKYDRTDMKRRKVTEEEQKDMTRLLGALVQKLLRKGSGFEDVVKWYPSSMTPHCTSCGSGVPK